MSISKAVSWSIIALLLPLFLFAQQEGRLLRFPDVHQDQVVFMYGGDLWTVSTSGGIARKLTSHKGLEILPKFSPDGKWIAFTGQYDGNDQVYVIPSEGGVPKQLTYLQPPEHLSERSGPENMVLNWYPDSKHVLFMSRRYTFHTWFGQLYSISIDGGMPEQLALPKGGLTSFNSTGEKIAYNRKFRNFRTWKRYTGGLAQDIWVYDFPNNTIQQITDWVGTDTDPMWVADKIYFTSDRPSSKHPDQKAPGRANIWEYDLKTKQFTQRTFFTKYDVKWASAGENKLVFENGGYLYLLDITQQNSEPQKLAVTMPGDRNLTRPSWEETKKLVSTFNVAPTGNRAVFEARGDIYTVPKEHGDIRNLTQTPGIREKYPVWSPDGKWIAYYSDRHGEDDLYLIKDEPGVKEFRVTSDAKVFRYPPIWSPDSRKLAFSDKSLRLWYVDIQKKQPVLVDSSDIWEIRNYKWSPDSKWLAYSKPHQTHFSSLYVYNLDDEQVHQVTSEMTNDWNPAWGTGGKYLYFLSDRHFNPTLGSFDFTYNFHRTAGVYVVNLAKDTQALFPPRSDEVKVEKKKENKKEEEEKADETPEVKIDFDGIQNRMVALPIDADNYRELHTADNAIFYVSYPIRGLAGKAEPVDPILHGFDLKERKDVKIAEKVGRYDISPDKEYLIYRQNGDYKITEAKPKEVTEAKTLNLSDLEAKVAYKKEWKEMFDEAWRYQRDYFYNPNMNNVNWDSMKVKYRQLIPYVADRYDLNYVIGEMIGELSNSHTYVGGGDYPDIQTVKYGQLGIDLTTEDGFYKITKIYPGDNTRKSRVSPLTKPGMDVPVGSFIIAIDGQPVRADDNFNEMLENKAGQQVKLTINDKPSSKDARDVTVEPVGSEFELRHWDWINSNRKKVSEMSDRQIGYIYLTDMSKTGLNEFVEQYYPQIRKKGLIIDVRYNGGGFVDQLILERLRRVLVGMSTSRNGGNSTEPPQVFTGYMATLINGFSASDGDIFPYFFRKYGLGELIGERTWGGVRGITGNPGIMDGGYIYPPQFSIYNLDSEWNIEKYGVPPDIEVDNLPTKVVEGHDPQLEKAVEVLMQKIKNNPESKHLELPPKPPYNPPYPKKHYKDLNMEPPGNQSN